VLVDVFNLGFSTLTRTKELLMKDTDISDELGKNLNRIIKLDEHWRSLRTRTNNPLERIMRDALLVLRPPGSAQAKLGTPT